MTELATLCISPEDVYEGVSQSPAAHNACKRMEEHHCLLAQHNIDPHFFLATVSVARRGFFEGKDALTVDEGGAARRDPTDMLLLGR
mmetsp:Transcript_42845/g.76874  ORF Transcript_42845/g.76874 Transcript_42845/m.76874 type:complete len:87 (+) Transcript_42845:58-318(+)